jgi:ribosomal protein S12 methylthiotransferase accessory factor
MSMPRTEPDLVDPRVCDPRSGLVRRCLELPLEPDDPRLFCFVAELARAENEPDAIGPGMRYGCGLGLTRQRAAEAALGEALERYCASVYDHELLRHAAYEDLDEAAILPSSFALFSDRQYSAFQAAWARGGREWCYEPFTERTRTAWVPGYSLTRARTRLAPAAFVYLPYWYERDEPYVADSFSTGLACARSRDAATLAALCEVVERDALCILWYNALTPRRIALDGGDELEELYRSRFARPGRQLVLLDATSDIAIPTVVAVLIDERGGSAVGAAAHPLAFEAARKALSEAAQARITAKRELVVGSARRYAPDFRDVVAFADHLRAYTAPGMRRHLQFLLRADRTIRLADLPGASAPADPLRHCLRLLEAGGWEPLAFDLTSLDVRQAGYRVVRVVIPGLVPLTARHEAPCWGGRRLREVPCATGQRQNPLDEVELNRSVHPFP